MSDGEAGYFLAHEQSPSIGFVTPDKTEPNSAKQSPGFARTSARASIVGEPVPLTRNSSLRSPAFTSHTAVMVMAKPPVELPAPITTPTHPAEQDKRPSSSSSRKGSQSQLSSLGEPGPELAEGRTTRSASESEARILVETSTVTVAIVPASAEEETFAAAHEKAEQAEQARVQEHSRALEREDQSQEESMAEAHNPSEERPLTSSCYAGGESQKVDDERPEIKVQSEVTADQQVASQLPTRSEPPAQTVGSATPPADFVAELEAIVPAPLVVRPRQDVGPIELEAPTDPSDCHLDLLQQLGTRKRSASSKHKPAGRLFQASKRINHQTGIQAEGLWRRQKS